MIKEVLLGSILGMCMVCALIGFLTACWANHRISSIKSDHDLRAKDFIYQSRERFTELEMQLRQKEEFISNWIMDLQVKMDVLEDKLYG